MSKHPLTDLKDIQLPPPPAAWPPAPGWSALIGLLIITSMIVLALAWRKYRLNQPKKEALALLRQIEQQFKQDNKVQNACIQINSLLKRVSLLYYPREQVAELHGTPWIEFLNQHGNKVDFTTVKAYLTEYPYTQQHAKNIDISELIKYSEQWIHSQQGGKPCSS